MANDLKAKLIKRQLEARQKALRAKKPEADMSFWGRVKDNVIGVDDGVMSTGEKIGTFLNKGGESLTLGVVGDEASAAVESLIPGVDYETRRDHYREQERALEESNPGAALTAEVGGGILGALLPGGAIGSLAKGGLLLRGGASAAAGAGMGGVYGFTEGEGDNRLASLRDGLLWGAGVGAATPVIGSAVRGVVNKFIQRTPKKQALAAAKTAAEQRASSGAQYRAFENADAQIGPEAMERLTSQVAKRIDDAGAPKIPGPLGLKPKSGRDINKTLGLMVKEASEGQAAAGPGRYGIPLRAIEDVRKQAGVLGREVDNAFRPTQGANIAKQAVNEIDQFIDSLRPEDMVAGDVKAATTALKKARSMWKSAVKTQMLENASDEADNYLSGTASGLRNQIKSLLRKNKKMKLFTKAEEDALRKVIGNTAVGRTVRLLGDGLGAKIATFGGGAAGGILGAAVGRGASEIAANVGDSMASRQMDIAKALISQGALQNLPQLPAATQNTIEGLLRRGGVALSQ
ncbi:hypothetical protein [Ruegeria sp. HKCCA4812]|uniref:hypothetical protein n=1 Tax=Ruegeria sp. HKCCA4812 TaxID=2682993 RepID=UPI0014894B0D|nr:hypothetical protein [Ruegeria sp. HKCCA4812]